MKTSDLIKKLQESLELCGDAELHVRVHDETHYGGKPATVCIEDRHHTAWYHNAQTKETFLNVRLLNDENDHFAEIVYHNPETY